MKNNIKLFAILTSIACTQSIKMYADCPTTWQAKGGYACSNTTPSQAYNSLTGADAGGADFDASVGACNKSYWNSESSNNVIDGVGYTRCVNSADGNDFGVQINTCQGQKLFNATAGYTGIKCTN